MQTFSINDLFKTLSEIITIKKQSGLKVYSKENVVIESRDSGNSK